MFVLLFDVFNWEKQVLKTCWNSKFLGNKTWRNELTLISKMYTRYICGNIYFGIIVFSYVLSTKWYLRLPLICFAWEINGFYQSSLGNEVDFRDIMNFSPNISAKNQNFKKLRHGFVDERALITTTLISSCHWKTQFYLRKKIPENAFLALIVNYRKIVQKNKLCHSKQQ